MNFHLEKSMNCPMGLGLSETTCPQRLREQNPVKVVFVLYDSEPSRSCSRLCLLFLLVIISLNERKPVLQEVRKIVKVRGGDFLRPPSYSRCGCWFGDRIYDCFH
jgi:hypothetical protein